eukprot:3093284-Alexandrium_andersonii.AAC.1
MNRPSADTVAANAVAIVRGASSGGGKSATRALSVGATEGPTTGTDETTRSSGIARGNVGM